MNRLVIIGNGFDMAHGLKTSYMDFINWYWAQRLNALLTENSAVSEDCLCKLDIINTRDYPSWFSYFRTHSWRDVITKEWKCPPLDIINFFKNNPDDFSVTFSSFFETIMQSIETRGWVDIENDYYQLLKKCAKNADCYHSVKNLNDQLSFLQKKLIEYLGTIETKQPKEDLYHDINLPFNLEDFSTHVKMIQKQYKSWGDSYPDRTMLLSFNYTATVKLYKNKNFIYNYIHGELEHPENIIFGYGDELDKDYKDILDRNDNELLKNNKSSRYLLTRHYHTMLEFIQSASFQVLIMGHSCGNSDRTLLNTVFEHNNCVSIKPFYHKWPDGSDNYLDIVQNISRNFTDMRLFRDRVVNKEQCQTM